MTSGSSPATGGQPTDPPAPAHLVRVPFRDGFLLAAEVEGWVFVPIRPVTETLGLTMQSQLPKLRGKGWAVIREILTTGADGKTYRMACLDLRSFPLWLATLDAAKVKPEVRPVLEAYQLEAADALYRRFLAPPAAPAHALSPAPQLPPPLAARLADEVLFLRAEIGRLETALGVRSARHGSLLEMRERLDRLELRAGLPILPPTPPAPSALAPSVLPPALPTTAEGLDAQLAILRATLARLARVVGFDADGRLPDSTYVPQVDWETTGVARVRAWMLDCTRSLTDEERRQRGRWRGLDLREVTRSFEAWGAEQSLGGMSPGHLVRFLALCGVQRWKTAGGVRYALALREPARAALPASEEEAPRGG